MNKCVVISTNDNPDYFQYVPYVIKAWNKLGWKVVTFLRGKKSIFKNIIDDENIFYFLEGETKYRDETIVQVSRLFGGILFDGLVMTADADMLPCTDYWTPNPEDITCYGHDLTGYGHYPICYIAMNTRNWARVMNFNSNDILTQIVSLLDNYQQASSDKWEEWWQVDQDIITEKLKVENVQSILRGHDNIFGFLANRRIDRYDWQTTKNIENPIDAHLPRPFNLQEIEELYLKI